MIGVAGDRIRIDAGQVYVNGKALEEDYVSPAFARSVHRGDGGAPHQYFVMGDHRNMSDDSRDFGALDQSYIYGKAAFVYWPLQKMGRVRSDAGCSLISAGTFSQDLRFSFGLYSLARISWLQSAFLVTIL